MCHHVLTVAHHVLTASEEVLASSHHEPPLPTALVVDGPDGGPPRLPPLAGHHLQVRCEGWRPGPGPLPAAGLTGPGGGEGDQHGGLSSSETKHSGDCLAWEI